MQRGNRLARLAGSAAAVVLVTAAIFLLRDSVPVLSLGSLYVLAVLPVAILWGRIWAVLVAVASMLTFNFFFLEPVHTFRLSERSNWLALAVYLATAIAVSELAARARQRAAEAEQREREEALLGELSVALLQGESLVEELPRIGSATGSSSGSQAHGSSSAITRRARGLGSWPESVWLDGSSSLTASERTGPRSGASSLRSPHFSQSGWTAMSLNARRWLQRGSEPVMRSRRRSCGR